MAQYSNVFVQQIAANGNAVFSETPVPAKGCIYHREGSGVVQSFSNLGCPYDNAVAETFFATFKKEEAYRRKYMAKRHFRKSVDAYIRFYNGIRPIKHGDIRH